MAEKVGKAPDLSDIVNCFADSEQAMVAAMPMVGQISKCLDDLAREANESGMDVRAFELGEYHSRLAGVSSALGGAINTLMKTHQDLYRLASSLDITIPQPRTGGR